MRKREVQREPLAFLLWGGILALMAGVPGFAQAAYEVVLKTIPATDQILPAETLVQTQVQILEQGRPVPNVWMALEITAPPTPWPLSTDYPWVEQSPLFRWEGQVSGGVLNFEMQFPIRGTYTFHIRFRPPDGSEEVQTRTLSIPEDPKEIWGFIGLVGGLASLGWGLGYWGGRYRRRTVLVKGLPWILLGFLWVGDPVQGKTFVEVSPEKGQPGSLNHIQVQFPRGGLAQTGILEVLDLEHQTVVYRIPVFSEGPRTQSVWVQFYDGAPHQVRWFLQKGSHQVLLGSVPVEVTPLAPPLGLRMRILSLLVGVILLGWLFGYRWATRNRRGA